MSAFYGPHMLAYLDKDKADRTAGYLRSGSIGCWHEDRLSIVAKVSQVLIIRISLQH
jgi:hypothetical protein